MSQFWINTIPVSPEFESQVCLIICSQEGQAQVQPESSQVRRECGYQWFSPECKYPLQPDIESSHTFTLTLIMFHPSQGSVVHSQFESNNNVF